MDKKNLTTEKKEKSIYHLFIFSKSGWNCCAVLKLHIILVGWRNTHKKVTFFPCKDYWFLWGRKKMCSMWYYWKECIGYNLLFKCIVKILQVNLSWEVLQCFVRPHPCQKSSSYIFIIKPLWEVIFGQKVNI